MRSIIEQLLTAFVLLQLLAIAGCDQETGSASGQHTARELVGTWKCSTSEQGVQFDVVWYVRPDGTDTYTFTVGDRSRQFAGTWKYSGETLTERVTDGTLCKSGIQWIDANKFILTIQDNGIPALTGVQRHYSRQ